MLKQPRLSTKVSLGKSNIISKNLKNTVFVDQNRFRDVLFGGLEKHENIALVNENDVFSVRFRKIPFGNECCANAVPADKVDTLRKLVGINYGKNTAPVVQIELRQRQRVSFGTVPKTCHFHRLGRSFRVFQDP